jgi:hypothetical protein
MADSMALAAPAGNFHMHSTRDTGETMDKHVVKRGLPYTISTKAQAPDIPPNGRIEVTLTRGGQKEVAMSFEWHEKEARILLRGGLWDPTQCGWATATKASQVSSFTLKHLRGRVQRDRRVVTRMC